MTRMGTAFGMRATRAADAKSALPPRKSSQVCAVMAKLQSGSRMYASTSAGSRESQSASVRVGANWPLSAKNDLLQPPPRRTGSEHRALDGRERAHDSLLRAGRTVRPRAPTPAYTRPESGRMAWAMNQPMESAKSTNGTPGNARAISIDTSRTS